MATKQNIQNLVATAALLGAMTLPAAALDISKHAKDSPEINAVLLKGTVTDGDAYELKTYLNKLPKKAMTVVYLDSPGGNLREGLKLGNLFFERKIETVVDEKASCTSACALAFLGGRGTNDKPMRAKVSTGKVGFHSFTRDFNDNITYSAGDLKTVLQRTQTEVFNIAEYLRGIETNMDVLRIMLGAPSSAMNFISDDDAIELNIQVWDAKSGKHVDPAPVLERLAKARAEAKIAAAQPTAPGTPGPVTAASDGGASPIKPTAAVTPAFSPKRPETPTAKSDSAGRAG